MVGEGLGTEKLSTVTLAEFLHLMTTLDGGLRRGDVRAAGVDLIGDFLPVGGTEVAAAE